MPHEEQIDDFKPEQSSPGAVRAFFLSVFLILLTFFILLNTISAINSEKKKKSLEALKRNFGSDSSIKISLVDEIEESLAEAGAEINVLNPFYNLKEKTSDILQTLAAEEIQKGNVMQVSFPEEKVFLSDSLEYTPDFRIFQEKIAAQSVNAILGTKMEYRILLDSTKEKISINRAGKIARDMVALGIKEQDIIVGLSEKASGKVLILFELKSQLESEPVVGTQ